TSLFIITSALYCKLAVIICLAFLLSEVITLNVPLYFFEVIFTYLYGGSILFFLYVFCYLLHDSSQKKRQRNKEKKDKEAKKDEEVASDAAASKSGERKQSFLQRILLQEAGWNNDKNGFLEIDYHFSLYFVGVIITTVAYGTGTEYEFQESSSKKE
ncbi:hypothetical protein Ocin01_02972, partial [Orchesella cincta]